MTFISYVQVQVELQPLTFVKRYPVSMQRSMIQAAWYEEFTQGRVITRYGKRPQAFYLILGGSGKEICIYTYDFVIEQHNSFYSAQQNIVYIQHA